MGVNNIPLTAFQRKAEGTVKSCTRVFPLDRQMDHRDFPGQQRLQLPSRRCQKHPVSLGKLLLRKLQYIAFYAALLKLRDNVKDPHVIPLFPAGPSGL